MALGRPDEEGDRGPPGRAHPRGPRPVVRADRRARGRPRRGARRARDPSRDARRRAARRGLRLRAGQPRPRRAAALWRRRRTTPKMPRVAGLVDIDPCEGLLLLIPDGEVTADLHGDHPGRSAGGPVRATVARPPARPGLGGDQGGMSSPGISGRALRGDRHAAELSPNEWCASRRPEGACPALVAHTMPPCGTPGCLLLATARRSHTRCRHPGPPMPSLPLSPGPCFAPCRPAGNSLTTPSGCSGAGWIKSCGAFCRAELWWPPT